jgi:hypothetical protein
MYWFQMLNLSYDFKTDLAVVRPGSLAGREAFQMTITASLRQATGGQGAVRMPEEGCIGHVLLVSGQDWD